MSLLKKLFCMHLTWDKPLINKLLPAWDETEWECQACGKRKKLPLNELPINYIERK